MHPQEATLHSLRRRRHATRARVRAFLGGLLGIGGAAAALAVLLQATSSQSTPVSDLRVLRASAAKDNATTTAAPEGSCGPFASWEETAGVVVYVFLLLYVFVALAIVCDDYFVSSLERITDALGLSQDVAGATFMAAGSSAPELFVSLADNVFTQPKASLGVGTIVGSAIFNILIIIALSALLAGQVLQLDWRPLLRDSLWYSWSIIALTYTIWDGVVDLYESLALFASYVAYCLYMSQNERVIRACCKRPTDDELLDQGDDVREDDAREGPTTQDTVDADRAAALVDGHFGGTATSGKRAWTIDIERPLDASRAAGQDDSDTTHDGALGAETARTRLGRQGSTGSQRAALHHPHRLGSQSKLNPMFRSKYRMFQYHPHLQERTASGRMVLEEHPEVHDADSSSSSAAATAQTAATATSSSATPGRTLRDLNVATLELAHGPGGKAAAKAAAAGDANADADADAEELGGYFDELFDVPPGVLPKIWFLLTRPIVVAMRLTIPDCRYPQFSGAWGYTSTFVLSIAWIALLSNFTVIWATKFGCLAHIPSALMGLTIIAAGTSVPDALSSVLVARDGQGDMAVSNAIGSNVFDILLGLGLPFFLSNLIYKEPVRIVVDDLALSIFILFGVLATVLLLLLVSRWRLHPIAGAIMAALYAAYVVFSYLRGLGQI